MRTRSGKTWPQPVICRYCTGGGNFFTHSEGSGERPNCSEVVGTRRLNGVRVLALCACKQKIGSEGARSLHVNLSRARRCA